MKTLSQIIQSTKAAIKRLNETAKDFDRYEDHEAARRVRWEVRVLQRKLVRLEGGNR